MQPLMIDVNFEQIILRVMLKSKTWSVTDILVTSLEVTFYTIKIDVYSVCT